MAGQASKTMLKRFWFWFNKPIVSEKHLKQWTNDLQVWRFNNSMKAYRTQSEFAMHFQSLQMWKNWMDNKYTNQPINVKYASLPLENVMVEPHQLELPISLMIGV